MADAYKVLYQGQLPSTVTVLATVGVGKSWIPKHITLRNVTAGAVTYELFINGTTAPFSYDSGEIPANGKVELDFMDSLEAGVTIAGVAGSASSISMLMTGDEVS